MTASLPSLADSLIQALHQPGQERLLDLVRNPLRLTLLCITWDGTLPETQAQLYENYLKKFYDWNQNLQELRDCAERCQTNITDLKNRLNRQLGELAKAALDLPQERFRLSQSLVEKYLGEELDDKSLCYLALQLGWLNRVGKDKRGQFIFAFYHATFQEYFAACAINNGNFFFKHVNPNSWKGFEKCSYRIFEPQWKEVFLLWMGRKDIKKNHKEALIQELVNFDDSCGGFYGYRSFLIAAAGIAEFKDCSIADDIVWRLIQLSFGKCFKLGEKRQINFNYGVNFTLEKQNIQQWVFWFAIREAAVEALKQTDKNRVVSILCLEIERLLLLKQVLFYWNNEDNTKLFDNKVRLILFQYDIKLTLELLAIFYKIIEDCHFQDEHLEFIIDWEVQNLENNLCTKLEILEKVDLVNFKNILTQIDFFPVTDDEELQIRFARILRRVDILSNIAKNSQKYTHRFQAAYSLSQINPSTSMLSEYIEEAIKQDSYKKGNESYLFGNIAMTYVDSTYFEKKIKSNLLSYKNIFMEIFDPKLSQRNYFTSMDMVEIFLNFAPRLEVKKSEIVQKMFELLSSPITQENVMDFWEFCPRLNAFLWYCAKTMPYQEFYQAWHYKIKTPEPINLAQLPQLLQTQLTETNLHQTLQLLCIDGSKFDNHDNPAPDIYLQLVKKHHCPKSTEGTPRTLTELKIYWQLLDWEKHPILIFYEEAKPQGFSQTFLDFLDRFDATICAIADSPHATIPTFSPQDPHLIQTIMNWLQRAILEA